MKNNLLQNILFLCTVALLSLVSCEKNNNPDITADNLKGMFVVCEGNYGSADGDITYYNTENSSTIKKLYYSVNEVVLGDVIQSFAIADTLGFLVVNNSQKVTVVNMKDFTTVKTLNGFSYPRSVVMADENSVYVTNGEGYTNNYIYSIDLTTLEKSDSIEVTTGPESVIAVDSKVYVAISGGWNNDGNTVIEIDPETFTISKTYNVSSCPVDLVADADNNIWVYCKGVADYTNYPDVTYSGMGLCKINSSTDEVATLPFISMSSSGIYNIAASSDGSTIYYLNEALYAISSSATVLPSESLVSGTFYGIDVDPESGNIIGLDAVGSQAVVYNTNGVEQYNFETGDFPSSVIFSY